MSAIAIDARLACALAVCTLAAAWLVPTPQWRTPLLAASLVFAIGIAISAAGGRGPAPADDVHYRRMTVTVVDAAPRDDGGSDLIVRLPDGALARSLAREPLRTIGERLSVRAKRETFDGPRNPGEPSERDLEAERGISWRLVGTTIFTGWAPDARDPTLWLPRLRAWASQRLHTTLPEPDATILAGAMWGERRPLPPDLRAEFQDTGTVHILVTAGLHLGVVATLVLGVLRALAFGRISASLLAIGVVWFYAALSGDHLPSVRAATMLTFALVAHAAGREALSWNALGAAAIVLGFWHPASVATASFALSFSCVAALLGFARPLGATLRAAGAPATAAEFGAVAVAAQLSTWPLTAATFLVVAPYAPLANVAVVPIVGVAMLGGFATLLAAPVPLLGQAAANVTQTLVDGIVACVRTVGTLPGAAIVATPPPMWTIIGYDAALVALAVALHRRRFVAPAGCVVVACAALCLWPPRPAEHSLVVTAIDVGQADALLIRTPSGHAYLVDAGGRLERGASGAGSAEAVGERVVVPFLIRQGIHHLDAVLLSHPHGDHAGGLAPVLRTLGAAAFADSGQSYPGHAYHDALDVARARGIPMLEPRGGDVLRTDDGVTFRFYGPTLPYITGSRNDINSNSLVFRLEYGRTRMLFMGDAGSETEARLLTSGVDLRADVLKVGHHGSAYGTTAAFVRAVSPKIAIISVGRHNLFGHPAAQTIETLRARRIDVFRTDRNGAIIARSGGSSFEVSTLLESRDTPGPLSAPVVGTARATMGRLNRVSADRYAPAASVRMRRAYATARAARSSASRASGAKNFVPGMPPPTASG